MTEKSKDVEVAALLRDLSSAEAHDRYDGIKKIITKKIDDRRVLDALLQVVAHDPSRAVRNFARSALDTFGVEHSEVEKDAPVTVALAQAAETTSKTLTESEKVPDEKQVEYSQIVAGLVGWCLVATLLSLSLVLSCSVLPLTLLALLVFGLSKNNKAIAGGILLAVGINFFFSLILGLGNNATCFIPFYMGDVIKEMWGF